jgi:glycerol-3-phosphate acyltransferase PlsX
VGVIVSIDTKSLQKITIALDAMGGDHGIESVIPGAALALDENPYLEFIFFGNEIGIFRELEQYPELKKVSRIEHTLQAVANTDKLTDALRKGKRTSMRLALDAVKSGEASCVVSSGNTGALMAMAKLVLTTLPGIERPAIASVMPSKKGRVVMLDLGANAQCDAENLAQFAILGSVFSRALGHAEKPTVGLLNIGSEQMKGNETLRETDKLLRHVTIPGEYHGFVEGNDIMIGTTDVVVTDGFTGNVALKTMEGVGHFFKDVVSSEFQRSIWSKIGYLISRNVFQRIKGRIDPRVYNGGPFLGLKGVCVKSHGSADSYSFSRAVLVAANMGSYGFIVTVIKEVERFTKHQNAITIRDAQITNNNDNNMDGTNA